MTSDDQSKEVRKWFGKQVPSTWFIETLDTRVDREEILVTGTLPPPESEEDAGAAALAEKASVIAFRESTRDARVEIAQRAEALFGRKVSWAVLCGSSFAPFTTLSVPVMTRLRMDQRQILDTLVGAGVARSRSDALGWCVRLVAEHEADWLTELQTAVDKVAKVRKKGPS